jgi:hypothetical protein
VLGRGFVCIIKTPVFQKRNNGGRHQHVKKHLCGWEWGGNEGWEGSP